jgi:hypothetical protein
VHEIIDRHPIIAEILDARSALLGEARVPYEGHAYRVFNFCRALHGAGADDDAIAVASAFHDLAVFPDGNLDYLEPSIAMMREWAITSGRSALAAEAALMIDMHHKLSRYTGEHQDLVEPFRQADLIDVALGAIRFGLPKEFVRDVRVRFPNAGFHGALVGVIGRWIVRHPTNPLPVFKL